MRRRHTRSTSVATVAAAVVASAGMTRAAAAQPELSLTAACAQGGLLLRQRSGGPPGDSLPDAIARRLLETQRMIATGDGPRDAGGGGRMRISLVRGWVGLHTSEISETRLAPDGRYVRYCDYPVVVSVEPASPAQRAGLEAGDTIVAYNGVDLRQGSEIALDRLLVPEDTVRVNVRRDGRPLVLPLVVGRRAEGPTGDVWTSFSAGSATGFGFVVVNPDRSRTVAVPRGASAGGAPQPNAARGTARERVGVELNGMTPFGAGPFAIGFGGSGLSAVAGAQMTAMDDDLRAAMIGGKSGVLVLKVADGTPASEAGLRAGDVIVSAGGADVTSPAAIQQAFLRTRQDRALPLRFARQGKVREVTLRW